MHIDVKYHFVCEVIAHGDIVVSKVDTKDNPTDIMRKPFLIAMFEHYLNMVFVIDVVHWACLEEEDWCFCFGDVFLKSLVVEFGSRLIFVVM